MRKQILHIIEKDGLKGLADKNDLEVVECIYDDIHLLECGKFIVFKEKCAGILSPGGKILMTLQPLRIHNLSPSNIFWYKTDDKRVYFTFKDDKVKYIDAVKIKCFNDKNGKNLFFLIKKAEELPYILFNANLSPIQTDFDGFELFGRGHMLLAMKGWLWGIVGERGIVSCKPNTIIEPIHSTKEEAIESLAKSLKADKAARRAPLIEKHKEIVAEIKKRDIFDEFISKGKNQDRYFIGCKNSRWGVAEVHTIAAHEYYVEIIIEPSFYHKEQAKAALASYIKNARKEKHQ